VKSLLQGIGQEPKDWHVRNLFHVVDEDNNGLIDKEGELLETFNFFRACCVCVCIYIYIYYARVVYITISPARFYYI
jgi:hypothetical protein